MANFTAYPVYSGNAALGARFENSPLIVGGYLQKQGGVRSWQPSITQPGTIASGGTVFNSTGVDCMVYLQAAASTITAIKILSSALSSATSYTVGGTVGAGSAISVVVPGPGGIAVTYGSLIAWTWQPL